MAKYTQGTMMLGADYYETDVEIASLLAEGRVLIGVGENTRIKYKSIQCSPLLYLSIEMLCRLLWSYIVLCRDCIIDKNARIGKNVLLRTQRVYKRLTDLQKGFYQALQSC
ncbi:unnamed protein product [Ilex paraguariensis]|uniref:glucose-1-phosphate adenylyltransferase n=1 Tax=Ilex paraguariensis TaxID=185542 RepID=A0ABC8R3K2_9AQUA